MSDTVMGKAAWDALGEGKLLHYDKKPWGLQIEGGKLEIKYDDGRTWSVNHKTFGHLFGDVYHVRPRIGDAPVWKDSE